MRLYQEQSKALRFNKQTYSELNTLFEMIKLNNDESEETEL